MKINKNEIICILIFIIHNGNVSLVYLLSIIMKKKKNYIDKNTLFVYSTVIIDNQKHVKKQKHLRFHWVY
jgi:hypothetical protein